MRPGAPWHERIGPATGPALRGSVGVGTPPSQCCPPFFLAQTTALFPFLFHISVCLEAVHFFVGGKIHIT